MRKGKRGRKNRNLQPGNLCKVLEPMGLYRYWDGMKGGDLRHVSQLRVDDIFVITAVRRTRTGSRRSVEVLFEGEIYHVLGTHWERFIRINA